MSTNHKRIHTRWFEVVSTNDQDYTYIVSINGKRYEYWLKDGMYHEAKAQLYKRRRSQGQQLQWLKANSSKYEVL